MAAFFNSRLDLSSLRRDDLDWINLSQHKKNDTALQVYN